MKNFLIIGNMNAVTYKVVFPLIKEGKMWLGVHANKTMRFVSPYENVQGDGNEISVPAVTWYTTLTNNRHNPPIQLTKRYNPTDYPKYDNYDAIEVSKTKGIPCDYDGVMGVPISFLGKWCSEQFEIVGYMASTITTEYNMGYPYINEEKGYARILIRRR